MNRFQIWHELHRPEINFCLWMGCGIDQFIWSINLPIIYLITQGFGIICMFLFIFSFKKER